MKSLLFIFVLLISGNGFGQSQASATFTASVTVIEPIGITNIADMNFASVDAKTGGTVTLTPDHNRITSGGVELADGTNVSAARFLVTGESDSSFSISIPKGEYVLSSGSQQIILKHFTSNLAGSGRLNAGKAEVRVGASIQIEPGQLPGEYHSLRPLPVTVNYN